MNDAALREVKRPSVRRAALTFSVAVATLAIGHSILGVRVEILLVLAAVTVGVAARPLGVGWSEMQKGIAGSWAAAAPALLVIVVVGMVIAAWMVCGAIPLLVHLGLRFISPPLFLVTAFVVCSGVSLATGTSWGTVGTVGVALAGVASGMGIPAAAAAGAIISGAYFGDKISPLSDSTNLASMAVGANLYDHVIALLWSTVPAWLIALSVYIVAGGTTLQEPRAELGPLVVAIEGHFALSGFALLPVGVLLIGALRRKPVVPWMVASAAVAVIVALVLQGPGRLAVLVGGSTPGRPVAVETLRFLVTGPVAATGNPALDGILSRGGMMGMIPALLVAFLSLAFAGIASRTGMLAVLLERLMPYARTPARLIIVAVGATLAVVVATGNGYLAVLLPGELLGGAFRKQGLATTNLSRVTGDAGTAVVALIPWSVAAVYMQGVLGVAAVEYVPWAVFCYAGVACSLLLAVRDVGVRRAAPSP